MQNNDTTNAVSELPVKAKRGRKPNKVTSSSELKMETEKAVETGVVTGSVVIGSVAEIVVEPELENLVKQIAKKRGRKPKGGKIVQQSIISELTIQPKPNVILHLKKCSMSDLLTQEPTESAHLESFHFPLNKNDLTYDLLESSSEEVSATPAYSNIITCPNEEKTFVGDEDACSKQMQKETWRKLKSLEHNLHANHVENSKSCCFWDTYEFDNAPVFIPKYHTKDSYNVYGCFCSPECATAYLMQEHIDSSTKFERYHLLNYIYGKMHNYTNQIKPAPNPHYMLDRFYGNLTIQEYRSLLKKDRLFLILDKPLSRILPELHEDNDDFILNNKIIPSNVQRGKKKLPVKTQQTDRFGILD